MRAQRLLGQFIRAFYNVPGSTAAGGSLGTDIGASTAATRLPSFRNCFWNTQHDHSQPWRSARLYHASSLLQFEYVSLNNIADNPGATKQPKRLGRGIGSGLGKTSGRGHKGQKARTGRGPKLGFEGGQTPLRLRVPKRGFHNPNKIVWVPLNLNTLQRWVSDGRLPTEQVVTMKTLRDSGAVGKKVKHGVKVLANGAERFQTPLHLEVSQCSASAREAIEKAGGSVTTVYYNTLGLRALLKPDWFAKKGRLLPRPARPPPKLAPRFDRVGALPPVTTLPTQPLATAAA